jgi:hypothetical protein
VRVWVCLQSLAYLQQHCRTCCCRGSFCSKAMVVFHSSSCCWLSHQTLQPSSTSIVSGVTRLWVGPAEDAEKVCSGALASCRT